MTGYQRLCIITCVVIFGLIVLGGVVRHTDSGLGCPDWPRCNGSFIPRWEKSTLIEYSHRLVASIAGLLILGVLIGAWKQYRRVPAMTYPATLAFLFVLVQGALGGAAVLNELPPEIVAVHLAMALTILTLLLIVTATSFALAESPPRINVSRAFGRVALLAAATTILLAVVGSYVSGAGYGLACNGWPLCNGEVFPSANVTSVQLHFLHRFIAFVLGLELLALVYIGWRDRQRAPTMASAAMVALVLYVVQAMVGAANIWTELAQGAGVAHLALASLLWVVLALLNIRVHRIYDLLPHGQPSTPRHGLVGAPR